LDGTNQGLAEAEAVAVAAGFNDATRGSEGRGLGIGLLQLARLRLSSPG